MPAGYAATTQVESTLGDAFSAEIRDLRVTESLPTDVGGGSRVHISPDTHSGRLITMLPRRTRRPSNIIPIGSPQGDDVFYLGLDLEFVGTNLGLPHMPDFVDVEVQFFLEGYGTSGASPATHRHEINLKPQLFAKLNANPRPLDGRVDQEMYHQLWVQVAKPDLAQIIEAPDPAITAWEDLFNPGTIYRVAATVKVVRVDYIPCHPHAALTGFVEGLVMQTEGWDSMTVAHPLPS